MVEQLRTPVKKAQNGLSLEEVEKIFAVEGIFLSEELIEDLEQFKQQGLSLKAQRKALAKKYGRAS